MKIATSRFGEIDICEDKIIHMPHGMLGFPDRRTFTLFQHKPDSPFYWFQSIDNPELAFVIVNPFLFKPDYDVDVAYALKDMSWDTDMEENALELYVVVNIPKGSPENMSANLIGPILINVEACQAVQMVLTDSEYSHKHPLVVQ
ncbi:MAG: flagellar assembly protein FliW [Desulfobacterales bacterium]